MSQPVYTPAPQSTHENPASFDWLFAFGGVAGSYRCTLKIMFADGKRTPRISWAMLPAGGKTGALPVAAVLIAGGCPPGNAIVLSAASSDDNSARPAGNLLVCSMNASTSDACAR